MDRSHDPDPAGRGAGRSAGSRRRPTRPHLRHVSITVAATLLAATLLACSSRTDPAAVPRNTTRGAGQGDASATAGLESSAPGDLISVLVRDPQLSRFSMLLKGTGLTELLATGGPYTVFAPDDSALAPMETELQQLVESGSVRWLSPRFRYLVVRGSIAPTELARSKALKTVTGETIAIATRGRTVLLNGRTHVMASHEASAGWVYRVDRLLAPPE